MGLILLWTQEMEIIKITNDDFFIAVQYKIIATNVSAWADGYHWDEAKVRRTFPADSSDLILTITSLNPQQEDRWVWTLHKKGIFSVHSIYSKLITEKYLKLATAQGTAFIPSRHLIDNVIIATEAIHYLKRHRNGNR
ncbi:peptide methionine sulfoxide reductase MsrA, partial [Striga asiatica]